MNNQKMLENLCVMLREYDEHTGSRGADGVIANPEKWDDSDHFPFYASAASLLIEIRGRMDTSTTPRTVSAAVNRIIKNTADSRPDMRGIFQRGDRFCVCDGYHCLRLKQDISSLPHTETAFNIDAAMDGNGVNKSGELVQLPSIADLKAWIAAEKAKYGGGKKSAKLRTPYFLDGCLYVNAQYLLDILQALPGCVAYKPASMTSPLYFSAESGDGMLLPVRPPKDETEKAESAA